MIENLSGIHETVSYQEYSQIRLYHNDEYENYPPHWHTPYEVIMPLVSTYRAVCNETEYHLREGDILIICPATLHELFAPEHGERIIFQPCLSSHAFPETDVIQALISPAVLITPEAYPEIHARIKELMLDIHEEHFSPGTYSETLIFSRFLEMLVLIGRCDTAPTWQGAAPKDTKQKEYLDKFLFITSYLNEHFTENLSLEDVAALAGFSKYHFTRLFRQYADTSFYKYLNQKRIDHAKTLLLDPKLSVIEVALQSGFSSLSAFLRMFRLMNRCTPTEFRKMYTSRI